MALLRQGFRWASKRNMKQYNHSKIEKYWQKEWAKKKIYKTLSSQEARRKTLRRQGYAGRELKPFYVLDMFPYPSGAGLHVGHPRGYIGSDVCARMKRMQGYNVLHPMGYDAFGLPAEQYAIEHKVHPREAVKRNVATFEKQLSMIGLSYDWSRKINTSDPDYYKWTQWIFLKLHNHYYDEKLQKARSISELIKKFEKENKEWEKLSPLEKQDHLMKYRLAYEGEAEVNWCPGLGTVLANDEVKEGQDGHLISERGGFPVEKIKIKQWFLRITAYADRLLSGLEELKWSLHLKEIQKNWIGRSEGAEIEFKLVARSQPLGAIKVFTTRADTLFGATYLVLSPEHAIIPKLKIENIKEVENYINQAKHKTAEERTRVEKDPSTGSGQAKTGVELKGVKAINPGNGEEIPIWISDYVLADYGTGAIMAVPAHDERDFAFAKKYNLPIREVIVNYDIDGMGWAPKAGKKFSTYRGVSAVIFNKKNDTVLCLRWAPQGWGTFVTGKLDPNENNFKEVARREIYEETGYKNLKLIYEQKNPYFTTYYHDGKDENRFTEMHRLFFELMDEEKDEISDEEKSKHEIVWVARKDIQKFITASYDQEIVEKVINGTFMEKSCFACHGILVDSKQFTGMTSEEARKKITDFVGGQIVTKYKMRDAVFARQRYWGEPIPLWRDKEGIIHEVKKLPLKLPNVKSYEPTGKAEGPLAGVKSWVAKGYETNTMPGWAGSSWYYLRYMDPKNKKELAGKKEIEYWQQVDIYVGGTEHATGHLLYARFWNKFLHDLEITPTEEPFKELHNQGMIIASDGRRMSKRWGNVVNPDDIVKTYGADTLRVYEMFMGPFTDSIAWSTESIIGPRRFLEKVWRVAQRLQINTDKKLINTDKIGENQSRNQSKSVDFSVEKLLHKTIKKVTEDIEAMRFNTAISSMMIFVNALDAEHTRKDAQIDIGNWVLFLKLLAPFAPHIAEELYNEQLITNNKKSLRKSAASIHEQEWPKWNPKLIIDETVKIAVQVNGKVRAEIEILADINEGEVREIALANENIKKWVEDKEVKKFIYVKNKLVNIVI